jgi:hypothetical protein
MLLSKYVCQELLDSDLLIDPGAILNAHMVLANVLRNQNVPYLVRKQGTSGSSSFRGKETDVGLGRPVVFTDNSPAVWLHHRLLLRGREQEGRQVDLAQCLHDRQVPVAQQLRGEESRRGPEWPLLSTSMGRVYPPIWTAGWKLSHILPCAPRVSDPTDPLAALAKDRPAEFYRLRSLRNMSPYNYFLSPLPSRYTMYIDGARPKGSDLGEDPRVIDWVIHLLRTEVFAAHPKVREGFDAFLDEAGLGEVVSRNPRDATVVVIAKYPAPQPPTRRPAVSGRPGLSSSPPPALPDCRVFQMNQAVSNETYSGFLCAPDESKGGWLRLTEMQPGDVILHNADAKIRAVSVVEPMNVDDRRLVTRGQSIRRTRGVVRACLRYDGDHLSIEDRPEIGFLACLITTVMSNIALRYARRFSGYAVEVPPEILRDRPDLADLVIKAWAAGRSSLEDDTDKLT